MGWLSKAFKSIAPVLGPLGGPLGAIGGAVISGVMSKKAAQTNRDFQQANSDTAHQREVADLRAAGLNPILSAGGRGASTPTGNVAQVPDYSQSVAGVSSRAISRAQMKATVKNLEQTNATNAFDAQIQSDALGVYKHNSVIKNGILGNVLGKKSGIPGPIGAVLGAAHSGVSKALDASKKMKKYRGFRDETSFLKKNYNKKATIDYKSSPQYRGN